MLHRRECQGTGAKHISLTSVAPLLFSCLALFVGLIGPNAWPVCVGWFLNGTTVTLHCRHCPTSDSLPGPRSPSRLAPSRLQGTCRLRGGWCSLRTCDRNAHSARCTRRRGLERQPACRSDSTAATTACGSSSVRGIGSSERSAACCADCTAAAACRRGGRRQSTTCRMSPLPCRDNGGLLVACWPHDRTGPRPSVHVAAHAIYMRFERLGSVTVPTRSLNIKNCSRLASRWINTHRPAQAGRGR